MNIKHILASLFFEIFISLACCVSLYIHYYTVRLICTIDLIIYSKNVRLSLLFFSSSLASSMKV